MDGHQLPEAPHVSGSVAADWEAFAVPAGRLVVHVDGNYVSKEYFELVNENRIAQDRYALANARISWHDASEKWEVAAWDKNISNHFYLTNAYDLQALGFDYQHRGLPRMYGVDASYYF